MRNSESDLSIAFPSINFEDLKRVIELIYVGEITLKDEQLEAFTSAVGLLQIREVVPSTPVPAQSSAEGSSSHASSQNRKLTKLRIPCLKPSTSLLLDHPSEFLSQPKLPRKSEVQTPTVICEFCKKPFERRSNQLQHQRICIQNPNRRLFQCSECERSFTRKFRYIEHLKKAHEQVESSKDQKAQVEHTRGKDMTLVKKFC